jgi:hypothetical protein
MLLGILYPADGRDDQDVYFPGAVDEPVAMVGILPDDIAKRIREFMEKRVNGQIVLDVCNGRIEHIELTTHIRVDKSQEGNVDKSG